MHLKYWLDPPLRDSVKSCFLHGTQTTFDFEGARAVGIDRVGASAAVSLLAVLLVASQATAGAWTQEKGKFYNRASVNRYFSDEEFDAERERKPFPTHGELADLNFSNHLEYGLTDRFTGIGSFTVKSLRNEDDVRLMRSFGIGDVDVGLRTKLAEGSVGVTALQLLSKIPAAYDVDVDLPLGNGEYEFAAHLLYGRSLWPILPGYCGLDIGYRWRNGDPNDEIRYLAELGGDAPGGFYLRGKLDGTRGRTNGPQFDNNGNPTVRNSADLGALDLTLGRRFGAHAALEAGFVKGLYGRNTTAGSTLTLALAYSGRLGGD